jgi:ribose/xylose/arabinose/galactoside ABC-type transport system permease subunit
MKAAAGGQDYSAVDFFYKYGLYMVFVALIAVFTALNATFISAANIVNLLQQSSSASIAATGMVCVMLTGGIDLTIGSIIYLSAAVVVMMTNAGLGILPALVVSIGIGAAVGVINGVMIARFKLVPIIVTLAMMFIVRGLTMALTEIKMQYFMNPVGDFIARYRVFGILPVIVIAMAVVVIAGQLTLKYTAFGRHLYAIGNNPVAARKSGIALDLKTFITYVISGSLAGLAGLIGGAQVGGVTTTYGSGQEFLVISACVLGGVSLFGGKGKVLPGAFIGVLIVMSIENGLVMVNANVYLYTVVRGIIIFLAVMVDCMRNKSDLR